MNASSLTHGRGNERSAPLLTPLPLYNPPLPPSQLRTNLFVPACPSLLLPRRWSRLSSASSTRAPSASPRRTRASPSTSRAAHPRSACPRSMAQSRPTSASKLTTALCAERSSAKRQRHCHCAVRCPSQPSHATEHSHRTKGPQLHVDHVRSYSDTSTMLAHTFVSFEPCPLPRQPAWRPFESASLRLAAGRCISNLVSMQSPLTHPLHGSPGLLMITLLSSSLPRRVAWCLVYSDVTTG